MNNTHKRKLSEALGPMMIEPEPMQFHVVGADGKKWSNLARDAGISRAAAYRHYYARAGTVQHVTTLHTQGDFLTEPVRIDNNTFQVQKHNTSTRTEEEGAESFDALISRFGTRRQGATNAMRVLKGKHEDFELISEGPNPAARARAAVTLAAEIGVSEFNRGGSYAVLNAMSGLYLMKRHAMTKEEFVDPKIGYRGAGKGGAGRVRKLMASEKPENALHLDRLRTIYDSHAVHKKGKAWSGKANDAGFRIWLEHKSKKWLQRV